MDSDNQQATRLIDDIHSMAKCLNDWKVVGRAFISGSPYICLRYNLLPTEK